MGGVLLPFTVVCPLAVIRPMFRYHLPCQLIVPPPPQFRPNLRPIAARSCSSISSWSAVPYTRQGLCRCRFPCYSFILPPIVLQIRRTYLAALICASPMAQCIRIACYPVYIGDTLCAYLQHANRFPIVAYGVSIATRFYGYQCRYQYCYYRFHRSPSNFLG